MKTPRLKTKHVRYNGASSRSVKTEKNHWTKIKCRVGEGGGRLSGGQQQRVNLARAMLKRGTIYLLDEPTTGLDNAVARSLQKTLDRLAENATTICITHHLGDLKTSDDVIYLDAGHIVEQGSFEELMNAKGTFYDQVNARGDE